MNPTKAHQAQTSFSAQGCLISNSPLDIIHITCHQVSERQLKSNMSKPGLLIFSPKLILPTEVLTEVRFQTPSAVNATIILVGRTKLGHATDCKIPLDFRDVKM